MDLSFIMKGLSPLFITLFIVAVLIPLERLYPALAARGVNKGRVSAILLIGIGSALTMLVFLAYGQTDYIRFLLPFQLINVSRFDVPDWVLFAGTFLFMDFVSYAIHFVSHKFLPLWRIHAVHHSDESVSAVSTLLQHPLAMLISIIFHLFFAVLLGLPLLVFILYGIVSTIHGVFTHADIRIPRRVEKVLRWLIVTPDLHRTHHSVDMQEGNSNFGAFLTLWDRLFGTYVEQPKAGVRDLVMGLPSSERPQKFSVAELLLHPFRRRN